MRLSYIFEALASGELAGIQFAANGEITPDRWGFVTKNINMGLGELHKRFSLREETVKVQAVADRRAYKLHSGFAVSSGDPAAHVIDTVAEPFKDNVIEILKVFNNGTRIFLDRPGGIYTTTPQTIYIDGTVITDTLYEVVYKANHPTIELIEMGVSLDPADIEVDLPMTHLQALLYYVASRIITPVATALNGIDGRGTHEGIQYRQLFEQECATLIMQGIDIDRLDEQDLFSKRGFV